LLAITSLTHTTAHLHTVDEEIHASSGMATVDVLPAEAGECRKMQINAAPEPSVTGVGPEKQRSWNFNFDKVRLSLSLCLCLCL
jgi:hypothetical protein